MYIGARNLFEEHEYPFQCKVEDLLVSKLNFNHLREIKSGLPKLAHSPKMTKQLSRMNKLIPMYECARNFFEEHEYPFQCKVEDPLISKLNFNQGWMHSFLCTYVLGICLRNMSTSSGVQ